MSVTDPTGLPPMSTLLPVTSWPAFGKTALTVYAPPPKSRIPTSTMAAITAAAAM